MSSILNKDKYQYKEYKREDGKTGRLYVIDDKVKVPSVTTILDATMPEKKRKILNDWRQRIGDKEADRVMRVSSTSGTAMHKSLEDYYLHETSPSNGSPIAIMMALSVINHCRFEEVYGCEVPLHYHDVYAGTADCVALEDGDLSIVDFKNSVSMKTEEMIEDYFLQLAAYAMAHDAMFNSNCNRGVIKMATQDGKFAEFEKKGSEFDIFKERWANRVKEYYEIAK